MQLPGCARPGAPPRVASAGMPALELDAVSKRYGRRPALAGVSFSVEPGSTVGLLGPNGAGKTSLLNCITGYYKPQEGQIFFNGEEITHLRTHHLTRLGIGRTYQNIELFPGMTVISNMLLARHVHSKYNVGKASLFLKSVREEEVRHRRVLEQVLGNVGLEIFRLT